MATLTPAQQAAIDFEKKKKTLDAIQQKRASGDLTITGAGAQKRVDAGTVPMSERDRITATVKKEGGSFAGGWQAEVDRRYAAQQEQARQASQSQSSNTSTQSVNTPTQTSMVKSGIVEAETPKTPNYIVKDGRVVEVRDGGGEYNPFAGLPEAERVGKTRDFITKEVAAGRATQEDLAKFEAQQLGVEYISPYDKTRMDKTRLEEQVDNAKKQAKLKEEQESATRAQQEETLQRNKSAAETAFLTGREGFQANSGIGKGIARGVTQQLETLTRAAESARLARDESAKQLEYYYKTNQSDLAAKEAERLTKLEEGVARAEKDRLAEERASRTNILDTITKVAALPAAVLSQFTPESLSEFVGGDLDLAFTTSLLSQSKELDLAQKELAKDPNNIEKQNKVFALQGKTDQIIIEDYKKKANFVNGVQSLVGKPPEQGGITQEQADMILQESGYMEKPLTPIEQQSKLLDLRIKQTQDATERAKLLKEQSNLSQLNNIYGTGENNIINKISTFTVGQTPDTRDKENPYYGQCAAVTNDVLGMPGFFGSTWESKISKRNKSADELPNVGDIFISSVGNAEVGHVGFVKDVTLDQRGNILVTLADSNRNGDLKWNERTVTLDQLKTDEKIVGYYSPVNASKTGVNSPSSNSVLYSQVYNQLGGLSKLSEGDRKSYDQSINALIALGEKDPNVIADTLKNFVITNPNNMDYAFNLMYAGMMNDKFNKGTLARYINSGNDFQAIRYAENSALEAADINTKDMAVFKDTANKLDKIFKNKDYFTDDGQIRPELAANLGAYDAVENKFALKFRPFAKDEERQKAQKLAGDLASLMAGYRNQISGTAVTESEAQYLEPLLASISDQPETLISKLESVKNNFESSINTRRDTAGLPQIDDIGKYASGDNEYMKSLYAIKKNQEQQPTESTKAPTAADLRNGEATKDPTGKYTFTKKKQ